jgi:hypothetical protein
MRLALYFDGFVLMTISLLLLALGHEYQRWRFRIPVFVMSFADFVLSLAMLASLYRPGIMAYWLWWRVVSDLSAGALVILYLLARRGHPLPDNRTVRFR